MKHPGLFEYYNADTGEPPERAASMFGWTAAVFIDLALQATAEQEAELVKPVGTSNSDESESPS